MPHPALIMKHQTGYLDEATFLKVKQFSFNEWRHLMDPYQVPSLTPYTFLNTINLNTWRTIY